MEEAGLNFKINIDMSCPYCGHSHDLTNWDNFEGNYIQSLCGNEGLDSCIGDEFECQKCQKTFKIGWVN